MKQPETISEMLRIASEATYKTPLLKHAHHEAEEDAKRAGFDLARMSTCGSSYAGSIERALKPLSWNLGRTEFRIYPVLITELLANAVDDERWEKVGTSELSPLAETVYLALYQGVYIDNEDGDTASRIYPLWERNALPALSPISQWDAAESSSPAGIDLVAQFDVYVRPINHESTTQLDSFLRLPFRYTAKSYQGGLERFVSYIRFWEDDYPRPFGKGREIV